MTSRRALLRLSNRCVGYSSGFHDGTRGAIKPKSGGSAGPLPLRRDDEPPSKGRYRRLSASLGGGHSASGRLSPGPPVLGIPGNDPLTVYPHAAVGGLVEASHCVLAGGKWWP